MMHSLVSRVWNNSDFRTARVVIYAATFVMTCVMLFADPFHYICNDPDFTGFCPTDGVKTGIWLLLHGNVQGAIDSNPLSLFAPAIASLCLADMMSMAVLAAREHTADKKATSPLKTK